MVGVVPGNRGGGVARHRTNESTENRAQITSRNASVAVYQQQLSMMGRGWQALVGAGYQQMSRIDGRIQTEHNTLVEGLQSVSLKHAGNPGHMITHNWSYARNLATSGAFMQSTECDCAFTCGGCLELGIGKCEVSFISRQHSILEGCA